MMLKPFIRTIVAMAMIVLATGARAEFDLDKLMRDTSDDFVRPVYAAFADSTKQLVAAQSALCGNPAEDQLKTARAAFSAVLGAWSRAEVFRVGPVVQENRLERILFYPDRKGTGLKQVQAVLADKDDTATEPTALAAKSVAMQGLGAFEFVSFGSGNETLMTLEGDFRCRYGLAIAQNLAEISRQLEASWTAGGEVDSDWNSHDEANPFARNDREALNLVLGTIIHGLEQIQDIRIGAFLDIKEGKDKPKSAIYWRSGLTIRSITENLQSLQSLFDVSGLDGALPDGQAYVAESIRFDFKAALEALKTLDRPVEELLADAKAREKLVFVRNTVGDLIHRFDQEFAVATGLAAGFSFADGD